MCVCVWSRKERDISFNKVDTAPTALGDCQFLFYMTYQKLNNKSQSLYFLFLIQNVTIPLNTLCDTPEYCNTLDENHWLNN